MVTLGEVIHDMAPKIAIGYNIHSVWNRTLSNYLASARRTYLVRVACGFNGICPIKSSFRKRHAQEVTLDCFTQTLNPQLQSPESYLYKHSRHRHAAHAVSTRKLHLLVVVASPLYLVVVDCDACDPSTAGGRNGPHRSTYSTTHI